MIDNNKKESFIHDVSLAASKTDFKVIQDYT